MVAVLKAPAWLRRRSQDGWTVPTLDLLFILLLVLVRLPHHPEADPKEAPPGNIMVEMSWPESQDSDIDLWVQAPGDVAVGYSNKAGRIFNLLRDDLGNQSEITAGNIEFSFSRGIPKGAYTVNVHLYRNTSAELPIHVSVRVLRQGTDGSFSELFARRVDLLHIGQELTVFRWKMDGEGNLVRGSEHRLPKALRARGRSQ